MNNEVTPSTPSESNKNDASKSGCCGARARYASGHGACGTHRRFWPMRMVFMLLILALGVFIGSRHAHAQPAPGGMGPGGPGMMMEGRMGQHMLNRILKVADANDEQRKKIEGIFKVAGEDMRKMHEQDRNQHQKDLQLWAAANLDKAALEQVRAQRIAKADQMSRRMHQAMIEAAEVLNADQRAKVVKEMGEHMKRGPRFGGEDHKH